METATLDMHLNMRFVNSWKLIQLTLQISNIIYEINKINPGH